MSVVALSSRIPMKEIGTNSDDDNEENIMFCGLLWKTFRSIKDFCENEENKYIPLNSKPFRQNEIHGKDAYEER